MTTYVGVIERENTIIVDGYSTAKSVKGVMHDIVRLMRIYNPEEVKTFMVNKEDSESLLNCTPEISDGGFFVQVEDVECASSLNEEKDEVEYKEGYNYYFCIRVVK